MTVHKISGHVNSHEQEEVSTASMSHTENDSGNSTPTKRCSKQINVETSSMVNGQRVLTTDIYCHGENDEVDK